MELQRLLRLDIYQVDTLQQLVGIFHQIVVRLYHFKLWHAQVQLDSLHRCPLRVYTWVWIQPLRVDSTFCSSSIQSMYFTNTSYRLQAKGGA